MRTANVTRAALSIIFGVSLVGRASVGSVAPKGLSPPSKFEYSQIHMGVRVSLTLYASGPEQAEGAAKAAFSEFARLEQIMSDYRPNSELMLLCSKAGGGPVAIGQDLYRVLERAQKVARASGGAFDVTCGPVVRLWRQARRDGKMPTDQALDEALKLMGYKKLRLDKRARSAELATPGMQLDLGGIAKGDACDRAMAEVRRAGVHRAMIECGGDIVVSAPPPGKAAWEVRILNDPGPPLMLQNAAVSTSGDAYQFVVIDGRRYSHVCDPRTGIGLTNRLQATVVAKDGLMSDPLTKVVCVLGASIGRRIACREGASEVRIVTGG